MDTNKRYRIYFTCPADRLTTAETKKRICKHDTLLLFNSTTLDAFGKGDYSVDTMSGVPNHFSEEDGIFQLLLRLRIALGVGIVSDYIDTI